MRLKLTLLLIICLWALPAYAVDLDIIAQIESSNNPQAVSFRGAKYGRGLHQISEICLKEYNNYNGTRYIPEDLFDVDINTSIADWYLNKRIPTMLVHYGIEVRLEAILWAYNAGIGRVVEGFMPEETKKYIKKYKGKSDR